MKLFLGKWQVAYRKKPAGSIFKDRETPFEYIPDLKGYTTADPFLFFENGERYLFAELLDLKAGLGRIGYCRYSKNGFSEWKVVIAEDWHLSYPNIFKYKDDIFIIPEASASGMLYAYKAVEFPDKWERIENPLIKNRKLADTTFLDYGDKHLMFTYDIEDYDNSRLYLYAVDENGKVENYVDGFISDDISCARPGGNFIKYNGDTIRVSQDCTGDYGSAVVFSKVEKCSPDGYEEKQILHILPDDITINKNHIYGIHTYNADDELEIIDFHETDFSLMTQFRRITKKLGLKL